jgi:RecB family exonuclease
MKYAPYSYSKIECFEQCPYKFKLQYIDKHKVPSENIHLERGTLFHHLLEHTTPNKNYKIPEYTSKILSESEIKEVYDKYNKFTIQPIFQRILNLPAIGKEIEFGLDKKLEPCSYYSENCVIRGKIDHLCINEDNVFFIVDWKTGKIKSKEYIPYANQLMLYAIWAFKALGKEKVIGNFVYVEHDSSFHEYVFEKQYLPEYSKAFGQKISKIEKTENFEKNINKLCDYCDYKKYGICN